MNAIDARGVFKSFKATRAIRGLDFAVEKGTIAGLIGPDGAGKSTLLRLLIGLLRIDEGTITVAGFDVARRPFDVKDRIGYMPQHFSLYGDLSVAENMKFFADLYSVPAGRFAERKKELLGFSALSPFEDRLARNLSGGMQKKLALACNLFHTPEILLLDEPTTGVDPVSRLELWQLLLELNGQGVTILMTTPYMDEAARCRLVGFISEGRILACDTPEALVLGMTDEIAELVAELEPAMRALKSVPGLKGIHPFGDRIHIVLGPESPDLDAVRSRLEAASVAVGSLRKIRPSFEDVFLALVEDPGRRPAAPPGAGA
jgi:ABC-2 type transport system ATP-binding protein